jgi:hypothetical protein
VETGRRLLEESELGGLRGQRRLADHGTESSFLWPYGEDADGSGKAEGETGCHRSGFAEQGAAVLKLRLN